MNPANDNNVPKNEPEKNKNSKPKEIKVSLWAILQPLYSWIGRTRKKWGDLFNQINRKDE